MNMYYYEVIHYEEGAGELLYKGIIAANSYAEAAKMLNEHIYEVIEIKRLRMIYDAQYIELPEEITVEALEDYIYGA